METIYSFKWGYYIHVYSGGYPTDNVIEVLKWENLTFQLYCKYKWYFEYRYALLRIKYPRALIRHDQFKRDLNEPEKADLLKNRIIGKKRTVTKWKNKLAAYVNNWNSFFPIEDDGPYRAAVVKIARLEEELIELQKEQQSWQ